MGLMSVIKQKLAKRDGATINRSQDIAYIQEFYKQYREKHRLDELQEEEMKMQASGAFSGDHKELERRAFNMKRVYATLKVLGDVVEALTNEAAPEGGADTLIPEQLKKIIKSDAEKIEGLYAYNIVPLDALAVANATMSFSEVKAAALAANESCSVTHHVALASQESILVVGLICCDGEGRLNDQSVLLEGSAEFSGGHRVRLDLQKLLKYSVFPGQVIGVEGHNLSGHCLVASRVIDSYPISVPSQMDDQHAPLAKRITIDPKSQINASKTPRGNISMLIAAGPFTTTDNLAFQPLEELLSYSRKKNFNILILMGPFVDSQHPQIKEGTIDKLFQDVFLEQVCIRLRDYCDDMGPNARVILVPSTRDAHHDFVFPQPAFEHHYFDGMSPQITCVANPGLLRINEIMVGVCTIDVLRHLSSEEISRDSGGKTNDRLSRLAAHILNQRSFYPLYPAASGVPLDLCASPEALDILVAPDILILPSDLAPFAKVLQLGEDLKTNENKCVSINPGRLAKGASGGTFAEILIQEREQSYNQNENLTSLDEKTAVSIVRL